MTIEVVDVAGTVRRILACHKIAIAIDAVRAAGGDSVGFNCDEDVAKHVAELFDRSLATDVRLSTDTHTWRMWAGWLLGVSVTLHVDYEPIAMATTSAVTEAVQ